MARQSCQRPKGDGQADTLAQVLMLMLLAADANDDAYADHDVFADAHADSDAVDAKLELNILKTL